MALRFTPDEIAQRVEEALPPLAVVSRRSPTSGDDLILSIQDVVGRVLNSDIDSIHYLVGLKARDLWVVCGRILTTLNNIERQALAATQSGTTANSRIEELTSIIDDIQISGSSVRPNLIQRFKNVATQYARSSTDDYGRTSVGVNPQSAKEEVTALLVDLRRDLGSLAGNISDWLDWFSRYNEFDVTAATDQRVSSYARDLLDRYVGSTAAEQSEGIIDALVVSAMLEYSTTRLDVLKNKFVGSPALTTAPATGQDIRTLTLTSTQPDEMPIRAGDVVLMRPSNSSGIPTVAGSVIRVSGLTVRVLVTDPAIPDQVLVNTYELTIRSLGLHNFDVARPKVQLGISLANGLLADPTRLVDAITTYAQAGSRSGFYTEGLYHVRASISTIRAALALVQANRVVAVDSLLEHLRSERLDLVAGALVNLRFNLLANITALLSQQDSIDYLADQVAEDLEQNSAPYVTAVIEDQYEDYFRTGE